LAISLSIFFIQTNYQKISAEELPMKAIGDLCVSTSGRELDKNKADVLRLVNDTNLGPVRLVEEKISG